MLGGIHLLLRGPATRLVGYATLLGAAAIKFYPACLMVLAARERLVQFLTITLISVAAAFLLVASFPTGLGHVMARLPQNGFSASDVPQLLAAIASANDEHHGIGLATRVGSTILLVCVCATLVQQLIRTMLPDFRVMPPGRRFFWLPVRCLSPSASSRRKTSFTGRSSSS